MSAYIWPLLDHIECNLVLNFGWAIPVVCSIALKLNGITSQLTAFPAREALEQVIEIGDICCFLQLDLWELCSNPHNGAQLTTEGKWAIPIHSNVSFNTTIIFDIMMTSFRTPCSHFMKENCLSEQRHLPVPFLSQTRIIGNSCAYRNDAATPHPSLTQKFHFCTSCLLEGSITLYCAQIKPIIQFSSISSLY